MIKKPTTYRIGNLKVVEWTNKDKEGKEFKNYQFEKFYKDQNDEWQTTTLFNYQDMIRLRSLIRKLDDSLNKLQTNEDKTE